MTGAWDRGYVADVEYNSGFYPDLAPAHLDLVCLLNSVEPPDRPARGATYAELGSGQSLTTAVLAAANPQDHFVAVDFHPTHVARARARARAAGLDNITILEASFDDLAAEPDRLPALDYVALHGVYTWVSPTLRSAIVRILAQKVVPGGAVYVGYNALPGWSAALPLQHLLHAFAGESAGRSDTRIQHALARVREVGEAGSIYIQDNPFLDRIGRAETAGEFTYLAHEYLSASWQPRFHADVVAEMIDAKLEFVGSASVLQNFPELMLTAEQRELRDRTGDPVLRETLKDYFTARSFRADVFVRGRRELDAATRDARLDALTLGLTAPRDEIALEFDTPVGKVEPKAAIYRPMLDALADGPATIGDLRNLPEVRCNGTPSAGEVAGLLTATGDVRPRPTPTADTRNAIALNTHLAATSLGASSNMPMALAAPGFGTGIACNTLALSVLAHMGDCGPDDAAGIAARIWAPIRDRGEALVQDGEPVEGESANLSILEERVRAVLERKLPVWRAAGALPADL